jgi:hypothetical protein
LASLQRQIDWFFKVRIWIGSRWIRNWKRLASQPIRFRHVAQSGSQVGARFFDAAPVSDRARKV